MLKLLFTCGHWHGLAKLRLHLDDTLDLLDEETGYIGRDLRGFIKKTCAFYDTCELKREVEARKRRKAKKQRNTVNACETQGQPSTRTAAPHIEANATAEDEDPIPKKLNMNTYKTHSLGDYARTIRRLGTTDSYSTVIVSNPEIE